MLDSGARLQTRLQLLFVLLGAGTWFLLVAHTPVEKVAIAYQEGRNAAKVGAVLIGVLKCIASTSSTIVETNKRHVSELPAMSLVLINKNLTLDAGLERRYCCSPVQHTV